MKKHLFLLLVTFLVFGCGVGDDIPSGNRDFPLSRSELMDPLYGYRVDDGDSRLLPSSVDHSANLPPARSQGLTGSCTAWAFGYYLKTYQEVMEEGWDIEAHTFSPMYVFAMQCRKCEQPYSFTAAFEMLSRYGCALWSSMPYEDYQLWYEPEMERETYARISIPDNIRAEAIEYRFGEIRWLYNLNQVKQELTLQPVLLAINHWADPPEAPSPENNFIAYESSRLQSHHVLVCAGYDDTRFGEGALKVITSRGMGWGEDGYSWIKYADFQSMVDCVIAIEDVPNVNAAGPSIREKPEAPSHVNASDSAGPYVDIAWDRVGTARYYKIMRAMPGDPKTWEVLGITYENRYRDYPEPGIAFYYAVVSVNEIGDSEHHATDDDRKGHVDQGTALGLSMPEPVLTWACNDPAGNSFFRVSNLYGAADSMHIVVSTGSEGPWHSFGWIVPGDFRIAWGPDTGYGGKRPFVKARLCRSDGYSGFSSAAQVASPITSPPDIASVRAFTGSSEGNAIRLSWNDEGRSTDFFELWRYRAAGDEANDWVLAGHALQSESVFYDKQAVPGIPYYYAIFAIHNGASGGPVILEQPVTISVTEPNLVLYDFTYQHGNLTNNQIQFDLTVWNEGGTGIPDYSIAVLAYDGGLERLRQASPLLNASDIAHQGQLPLAPGESHTLSFSIPLSASFSDGRLYLWGIWIDYEDAIEESYESDNLLTGSHVWWISPGNLDLMEGEEAVNPARSSARPFSKKYKENPELSGTEGKDAGPIPYKRPSFCIRHGE